MMEKSSDDENLDTIIPKNSREDEEKFEDFGSNKSGKSKEMPRIKGLIDPDTLDKSALISHRHKEYR